MLCCCGVTQNKHSLPFPRLSWTAPGRGEPGGPMPWQQDWPQHSQGVAVVLGHTDATVGQQPGHLSAQAALDAVDGLVEPPQVPELDLAIAAHRDQEVAEEEKGSTESCACPTTGPSWPQSCSASTALTLESPTQPLGHCTGPKWHWHHGLPSPSCQRSFSCRRKLLPWQHLCLLLPSPVSLAPLNAPDCVVMGWKALERVELEGGVRLVHALQQGFGEQVPHCHGACGKTCVCEALPTVQVLQWGTGRATEHSSQAGEQDRMVAGHSHSTGRAMGQAGAGAPSRQCGSRSW